MCFFTFNLLAKRLLAFGIKGIIGRLPRVPQRGSVQFQVSSESVFSLRRADFALLVLLLTTPQPLHQVE